MWGTVLAALALAAPSRADVTLTGRVVRVVGRDTVGVPGVRVVLHRVMTSRQGPIDSLFSRREGSFSFRFHPDSGAIFLVSARRAGIEYFAPPVIIPSGSALPDPVLLTVADTSSTAPVGLAARHLVVSAPAADGTRAVLELLVLENRGLLTRVPHDSLTPTWSVTLSPEARRFELIESDLATDVVNFSGNVLSIYAPLPQGQRQITVQYQLPAGVRRWVIPVSDSVVAMNVLAEEPTATLVGALVAADSQLVQAKRFSRWHGAVAPGASVVLIFDFTGTPSWVLPALVASLAVPLVGALALLRRRVRRPVVVTAPGAGRSRLPPHGEALLQRIASLDAAFAGGATAHGSEEWQEYLRERSRLKQELERHLPP